MYKIGKKDGEVFGLDLWLSQSMTNDGFLEFTVILVSSSLKVLL